MHGRRVWPERTRPPHQPCRREGSGGQALLVFGGLLREMEVEWHPLGASCDNLDGGFVDCADAVDSSTDVRLMLVLEARDALSPSIW